MCPASVIDCQSPSSYPGRGYLRGRGDAYRQRRDWQSLRRSEPPDSRCTGRDHYALRYAIAVPARWRHAEQETLCSVVNISKGGCYLAAEPPATGEGFAEGQVGSLALTMPASTEPSARSPITAGPEVTIRAQLAWVNADGQFDKPSGFGVHFAGSQRRLVRQLLRETRTVLVR